MTYPHYRSHSIKCRNKHCLNTALIRRSSRQGDTSALSAEWNCCVELITDTVFQRNAVDEVYVRVKH